MDRADGSTRYETCCQGIGTAAFPPKAIGMAVGLRFRDGIETEQVECLHGSIGHRGNPETAPFAVAFGNVHPAERLRLVTVPTQSAESGRLGFRCVPEDSGVGFGQEVLAELFRSSGSSRSPVKLQLLCA